MGVLLYAANEGYLKDIEVSKLGSFESSLLAYMQNNHAELMDGIVATGNYNDDIEKSIKAALTNFKATQTW